MSTLNPTAPVYKSLENQHWERLNNEEAPTDIAWVLNNKKTILELHSKKIDCRVFNTQCTYCQRFFKPCMIWNKECEDWRSEPKCRWCHADLDSFDDDHKFEIGRHIHCNKFRADTCGRGYLTLVPPTLPPRPAHRRSRPSKHECVSSIASLRSPEVVLTTINPSMSQRERKKLVAEENARKQAVVESKLNKQAAIKKEGNALIKLVEKVPAEETVRKKAVIEKKGSTTIKMRQKTLAEEQSRKKAVTI